MDFEDEDDDEEDDDEGESDEEEENGKNIKKTVAKMVAGGKSVSFKNFLIEKEI
jgi:hypothetical protein